MWCLILLIAALFPRITLALVYLFSSFIDRATPEPSLLWAVLGFLFLPLSFLWFCAVQNWYGGEWGVLQVLVMAFCLLGDLGGGDTLVRRREVVVVRERA